MDDKLMPGARRSAAVSDDVTDFCHGMSAWSLRGRSDDDEAEDVTLSEYFRSY